MTVQFAIAARSAAIRIAALRQAIAMVAAMPDRQRLVRLLTQDGAVSPKSIAFAREWGITTILDRRQGQGGRPLDLAGPPRRRYCHNEPYRVEVAGQTRATERRR